MIFLRILFALSPSFGNILYCHINLRPHSIAYFQPGPCSMFAAHFGTFFAILDDLGPNIPAYLATPLYFGPSCFSLNSWAQYCLLFGPTPLCFGPSCFSLNSWAQYCLLFGPTSLYFGPSCFFLNSWAQIFLLLGPTPLYFGPSCFFLNL